MTNSSVYRAANPASADRNRRMNQARERARRALSAEFPDRFQELYEQELQAAGLGPLRTPGRQPERTDTP